MNIYKPKKLKKINWKKGAGEFIGFTVIAVIISSMIILMGATLQMSTSTGDLSKALTTTSRGVSVCTSLDDAKKQGQKIAENALLGNKNVTKVSTKVEYATGTEDWHSGGFVVVTITANINTISPIDPAPRTKKALVAIEGLNGSTIMIPEPYGSGGFTATEYDIFFPKWSKGTMQRKIANYWDELGRPWTNHIASINGYYLVACTSTFGAVGDKIRFTLDDGTTINCIIADIKSQSTADACNEWGRNNGLTIIEPEVESSFYKLYDNPGSNSWMPEWKGKRVVKAQNFGPYPFP